MKTAHPAVPAFAATLLAQQPTVDNAKLETRALSGTVAAELSRAGAGPFWAAYSRNRSSRASTAICARGTGMASDDSGRTLGSPMRLEGETALVILIRMENSRVDQLRVTSPDCHLDAGGVPFYWLTGVPAAESIAWLKTQAGVAYSDTAIMAISLHQNNCRGSGSPMRLAQTTEPVEVRKRAAMWLGNSRGTRGTATLKAHARRRSNSDVTRPRGLRAIENERSRRHSARDRSRSQRQRSAPSRPGAVLAGPESAVSDFSGGHRERTCERSGFCCA